MKDYYLIRAYLSSLINSYIFEEEILEMNNSPKRAKNAIVLTYRSLFIQQILIQLKMVVKNVLN
jgi:hypothetical protein